MKVSRFGLALALILLSVRYRYLSGDMYICLMPSCHQGSGGEVFRFQLLSVQITTQVINISYITNLENHVLRSGQLLSPALKGFRPSQSKLSQAHPTPQSPGFGWDRAKTSGLHHNIPLLSDYHKI
ncbi:hypothetical protein ACN42_g10509 [Penicillium freii]|uniref:Secreted protein n=1 Tax=Penicillium freii TaxID=48697 RepID=A0A124GQ14_PENFR|nr:hypothetical protein ACN42_g10509 [Penicillium freii]